MFCPADLQIYTERLVFTWIQVLFCSIAYYFNSLFQYGKIMVIAAFIFLIMFFSVYSEVIIGSLGIILPLTSLTLFYLSISLGWRNGLLIAVVAGTSIDMLYGRSHIITPFLMILTVGVSMVWLHRGDPVSILPNLIPGALAAFIVTFPPVAVSIYYQESYIRGIRLLSMSVISGALLLPVIISFLDSVAERCGLPLYRKARAEALNKR